MFLTNKINTNDNFFIYIGLLKKVNLAFELNSHIKLNSHLELN